MTSPLSNPTLEQIVLSQAEKLVEKLVYEDHRSNAATIGNRAYSVRDGIDTISLEELMECQKAAKDAFSTGPELWVYAGKAFLELLTKTDWGDDRVGIVPFRYPENYLSNLTSAGERGIRRAYDDEMGTLFSRLWEKFLEVEARQDIDAFRRGSAW